MEPAVGLDPFVPAKPLQWRWTHWLDAWRIAVTGRQEVVRRQRYCSKTVRIDRTPHSGGRPELPHRRPGHGGNDADPLIESAIDRGHTEGMPFTPSMSSKQCGVSESKGVLTIAHTRHKYASQAVTLARSIQSPEKALPPPHLRPDHTVSTYQSSNAETDSSLRVYPFFERSR